MNATSEICSKLLFSLLFILAAALFSSGVEAGASDPRFFGTYCGTHRVNVDFDWPLRDEHYDLEIKVYAKHAEPGPGKGVVTGRGVAVARNVGEKLRERGGLSEGQRFPFVFAGLVRRRGVLAGSARVSGMAPGSATASLAGDGETITMEAFDFGEIELSKASCGNERPSAEIVDPGRGLTWGQPDSVSSIVSDTEDDVSDLYMVWTTNRHSDWRQEGKGRIFAHTEELAAGAHEISLTVTDSGGRSASAERTIVITNTPPDEPVIDAPTRNARFTSGQCVFFRGRASDRQQGNLTNASLVWTSNLVAEPLGSGGELLCRAPRCTLPQGTHTISLTATDGAGLSSSTSIPVTIEPRTADNSAPSVWVKKPDNWSMYGGGVSPPDPEDEDEVPRYPAFTQTITMEAGFCDNEDDALANDRFEWIVHERIVADDGSVTWEAVDLGVDEEGESLHLGKVIHWTLDPADYDSSGDTRYEIKVTVTDNNGQPRTSEPVYIIVIPGVGLY